MNNKTNLPEWAPEDAGREFAGYVMPGVEGGHDGMPGGKGFAKVVARPVKAQLTTEEYIEGIRSDNRTILARAITLIESNSPKHIEKAQEVIKGILPYTGNSIRIGITGAPGAGKSTFIESFGSFLCKMGRKPAVLAIDPSSTRTRGSILGDKTRMEKLTQFDNAFIRPSPSGGTLGGVARKTRETILLCEAAGFDTIIIETVGVGQSETTVRSMVDFFLLVLLPGGGDELQGMKKGAVELADALAVNKADGDNERTARITKIDYQNAVHYLMPATPGWDTRVLTCSALNDIGIDDVWQTIQDFIANTKASGVLDNRRNDQLLEWVYSMIEEELKNRFYHHPEIAAVMPNIRRDVLSGGVTPTNAVSKLLSIYK